MDDTERRSCEGGKDHRVLGYRFGHSLAPGEACHDEVAGIVPIDLGASRTTRLAAVAASLEDEALCALGDLTACAIDGVLAPIEAHGVRTVMGLA
jgi:hypothetical protein